LPAQILIPLKSTLHLQLVVMDKHLLDNELTAQILMPPESNFLLHLVAMDKHVLDDESAPQFKMLQTLDHPQGNSHSPTITEVKCSCGLQLRARAILLR
jgi:hypothetical protein